MNKNIPSLIFLFTVFNLTLSAQNFSYFFVAFKDKPEADKELLNPKSFLSEKSLKRRAKFNITLSETDVPVSKDYIKKALFNSKIILMNSSKWLNGILVKTTDSSMINELRKENYVKYCKYLGTVNESTQVMPPAKFKSMAKPVVNTDSLIKPAYNVNKDFYGVTYAQNNLINVNYLHKLKYYGQGMTVAVLDAGFFEANKVKGMEKLNFIDLGIKDFVTNDNSIWEDDRHGANVLSTMYSIKQGIFVGTAPFAKYHLLRTENATSEFPIEEYNWLIAAEYADSSGVDVITSSLGYNVFDDNSLSYNHADLNGKRSTIAFAANTAYSKGILVIVSAGNEGQSKWRKIGTPSDAEGVISVGAVDSDGYYAEFSSYGPTSDGRIKPDLVSMGKRAYVNSSSGAYTGNGTSYATPILSGSIICLMQACPNLALEKYKKALIESSTHYLIPDSAYGYGIPDLGLAAVILGNYNGVDTSKDIVWEKEEPVFFQQANLHFRSSKSQKIQIKISGKKKRKFKTVKTLTVKLQKGEWLHNSDVITIFNKQYKKKKRKKFKSLYIELKTESMNYTREIKVN